MNTLGNRSNIT